MIEITFEKAPGLKDRKLPYILIAVQITTLQVI
jgi:hypothetical protein